MAGCAWPGGRVPRFQELPVLVEARAGLPQEVCSTGVARSPSSRLMSAVVRAHPVPEDRQESGILEDGVPPLHALQGGDVLEEADLQAHCRESHIVHEAPVGFGQLAGDHEFQPTRAPTTRRRPPTARPS